MIVSITRPSGAKTSTASSGELSAEACKLTGDGISDNAPRLQAVLNRADVKKICFNNPKGGNYLLDDDVIIPPGKILSFSPGCKLVGGGGISGGIIDAPYNVQIFDTTLSIQIGSTTSEYISAKWFGAVGSGAVDDAPALQKAIDCCLHPNSKKNSLFIPAGTYLINTGLIVARIAGGAYQQVSIHITGEKTSYAVLGKETIITCQHNDNFALCIEMGKGCSVENLQILGQNTISYGWAEIPNTPAASYIINGCRPNRYSPYAGIVLDGFSSATAGVNRYPRIPVSYYTQRTNNSGSTDCRFSNITVSGFVVNICLSPNGFTQNNDSHVFEHLWLNRCHVAMACCQSQTRQIQVRNLKCWDTVHTIFDTTSYGQGNGTQAYVQDVDIAGGVYQLFTHNAGWSAQFFKNIYAELLYRLGDAADSQLPTHFKDCYIDLMIPQEGSAYPASLMQCPYASFDGGGLRYYGIPGWVPFNFNVNIGAKQKVSFKNMTLHQPAASADGDDTNVDIFDYDNIVFSGGPLGNIPSGKAMAGSEKLVMNGQNPAQYWRHAENMIIPVIKSGTQFQCGFLQRRSINSTWQANISSVLGLTENAAYNAAINEMTFDTPAYIPDATELFYVGMPVTTRTLGIIGRVKSIAGRQVTLDKCIKLTGLLAGINVSFTPRRTLSFSYIAEATNGSAVLTNVVGDGEAAANTLLVGTHIYGDGFYYGTYVKQVVGSTVTLNRPFQGISGRVCFAGYDYDEIGECYGLAPVNAEWQAFKPVIRKGTVIRVQGVEGVIAQRCMKPGIIGSATVPPVFGNIYDNSPVTKNANFTQTIPAGTFISRIVVAPAADLAAFKVGTASGLDDVIAEQPIASADGHSVIAIDRYFPAGATLHLEGITSQTEIIITKE
jgi:hypothetical protein